jgi:hypothetical protein
MAGFAGFNSSSGGGGPIPPGSITNVEIALGTILNTNIFPRTIIDTNIALNTIKGNVTPLTSNIANNTIAGGVGGAGTGNIGPGTLQGAADPAKPSDIAAQSIKGSGLGGPPSDIAPGSISGPDIAPGGIPSSCLGSSALPSENMLTNSAFNFAQLFDPSVAMTAIDSGVSFDAWKLSFEAADLQFERIPGAPPHCKLTKLTNPGKILMIQALDSALSQQLIARDVQFQCSFYPTANMSVHLAVLQWNGSINTMPSPLVTAWNADTVNPTFDLGFSIAYESGPLAMVALTPYLWGISLTNGIAANFVVAIWTDSQLSVGDTLSIYMPGLYKDAGFRSWQPLSSAEDWARCERFIEKSYNRDDVPGSLTPVACIAGVQNGTQDVGTIRFRVSKPKTPAITFYSTNTGAAGNWYDPTAASDIGVAALNVGDGGFVHQIGIGTDGNPYIGHFVADASL